MNRIRWTNDEDKVLAAAYMRGGIAACRPLFPLRSDDGLKKRIHLLSLRNGGVGRLK